MASRRITVVVNSYQEFINKVMKKLTLDIVANLVSTPEPKTGTGTPVDTGWARANWVPQVGTPRESVVGSRPTDKDAEEFSTAVQDTEVAKIAIGYRAEMGPIYISNNVPYIVALNDGHSKQAPAGFVQNAIRKAVLVDLRGTR